MAWLSWPVTAAFQVNPNVVNGPRDGRALVGIGLKVQLEHLVFQLRDVAGALGSVLLEQVFQVRVLHIHHRVGVAFLAILQGFNEFVEQGLRGFGFHNGKKF